MPIDPILSFNVAISGMVFLTVSLFLWALFGGYDKKAGKLESRLVRLGFSDDGPTKETQSEEARARKALQQALTELETRKKSRERFYLTDLLRTSGTARSLTRHLLISFVIAVISFLALWLFGTGLALSVLLAGLIGFGLPILHLRHLASRRMTAFANDLPGALDLIVRGIRAGLPLIECLKLAANEWHDPLRSEFLQVTNDMSMGLSIKEAISRFADRVPVREARLFAIVIAIQAQSGGNLSEVLNNLADLLREKSKLQTKARAMSSEARTSALIIGALPILLVAGFGLFSPGYLQPLFATDVGNMILIGCSIWMGFGVLVMRAMMRVKL